MTITLSAIAAPCAAAPGVARVAQPVMGTVLEVTVLAHDPAAAHRLASEAVAIARHWDDVLSTWRDDAELARLNARAGENVTISASLRRALVRMLALHAQTGGAFDPAVGAEVKALRDGRSAQGRAAVPFGRAVELAGGTARVQVGVKLDAGAVGKGIALDDIAAHLRAGDAESWFLDFGGSSQLAHGRPDGATGWKIGLTGVAAGRLHGVFELDHGSLSTSRASAAADPAGTILDPRTGAPVEPPRVATVFAPDATTADAWSTALVVLGRPGVERARAAGFEALYEDAAGLVVTRGFRSGQRALR